MTKNSNFTVKAVQNATVSGIVCWLVRNTNVLGQAKMLTTPAKYGKQWLFCKNCDLDFDFPNKNVIFMLNQCLGCDFDFKITFYCVILILIWNQLQSDVSHHWVCYYIERYGKAIVLLTWQLGSIVIWCLCSFYVLTTGLNYCHSLLDYNHIQKSLAWLHCLITST